MKNQFIITLALFCMVSFSNQSMAQISSQRTTGYDFKKNIKCRIISTNQACVLSFEGVAATREAGSGLATGRRQHEPIRFIVNPVDNTVSEISSPRDAASGLATGKRQYSPIVITKELDKSTPLLAKAVMTNDDQGSTEDSARNSGGGAGKVSLSDIHFVIQNKGKAIELDVSPEGVCDISTDLPDGEYAMTASWSWGASQRNTLSSGKASPKSCSVNFYLQIENGVCMAINQKGTSGSNSKR